MKTLFLSPLLGLIALSGCASTPVAPRELVDARSTLARASTGPAARLALVDLHNARQDLERAEQSFQSQPTSDVTVDLSYIALRHAQTVEARADTLQADQDRQRADQERAQATGQRLAQTQTALQQSQQTVARTAEQLAAERTARMEAERQAAAAMASLRQVAAVREEQRGMVITLSGSVLFATGESTLLPIASDRLNQVAQAIRDQGARRLRVEGYTDSRGSATDNQTLSLARANSVRNYLVTRGIPAEQIEAVGRGPEAPVADNATPEGRANNRRVEIVVAPAAPGSNSMAMGAAPTPAPH